MTDNRRSKIKCYFFKIELNSIIEQTQYQINYQLKIKSFMNHFQISAINNNNAKVEDTNRILKLQQQLLASKKQLTAKESLWQRERTQLISKSQIMNLQLIELKQRQQNLVHINQTLSNALGNTDFGAKNSRNSQHDSHLKQLKDMLSQFINIEKGVGNMKLQDKENQQKHKESIKQILVSKNTSVAKKTQVVGIQTDRANFEPLLTKNQNAIDQEQKQMQSKIKTKNCQCRSKIDWYEQKMKMLENFISQKQSIIKQKDSIIEDLESQLTVLNQSLIHNHNNTNHFERDDEEKQLLIREMQQKFQRIYSQRIKEEVRMLENNYREKLEDARRKMQTKQVGRKSSKSILIYENEDSMKRNNANQNQRYSNGNKGSRMQINSHRDNRVAYELQDRITYDLQDQSYLNNQSNYFNQLDDSYSEQSSVNYDANHLLCEYCRRVYSIQLFKKHMKRCKAFQNQEIKTLKKRQDEIQSRLIQLNQTQEENTGPKSRRSINLVTKKQSRPSIKQVPTNKQKKQRQPLSSIPNHQNISQKSNRSRIDYTDSAKSRKREMIEYQLRNIMQVYKDRDDRKQRNGYQSQIVTPSSQHSGFSICDHLQQSDVPYQFY